MVGTAYLPNGQDRAFRWTAETGSESLVLSLNPFGGGLSPRSYATGISRDGSTIVGASYMGQAFAATVNAAFRWTEAEGMVDLGIKFVGDGAHGQMP